MKYIKFIGFSLCMAIVFMACDKKDDNNNNTLSDTDRNFMIMAAYSNHAEIEAGQLAATQAENDTVRAFGAMMVLDHADATAKLDSVNSPFNVSLPTTPDPEHMAKKAYLMTLTGYSFDTAYINSQVVDHQKTVALFQTEISSGQNASEKNFASANLPVIQMHLVEATAIADSLQ